MTTEIEPPATPTAPAPAPWAGLWLILACAICGYKTLTQEGLCVDCREIREWSRVNRLFNRLLCGRRPVEVEALLGRLWS
jgi:hypothetical protein